MHGLDRSFTLTGSFSSFVESSCVSLNPFFKLGKVSHIQTPAQNVAHRHKRGINLHLEGEPTSVLPLKLNYSFKATTGIVLKEISTDLSRCSRHATAERLIC